MELLYKVKYHSVFLKDIEQLKKSVNEKKFTKFMNQFRFEKAMLKRFPRMYPIIENRKSQNQEYRRIVLEKHIIIYKINSRDIIFLRIFHEKTNYINQIKKLSRI